MDRVADELYADIDELHANSPLCEERYPVAYYRDLAVAPEFQGDRVATRLVHTLASKLLSESTNIIAPIWHRPDSPTDEMLDKYPAEHFHTFSEYDLHRSGAACPVCPDDGDCTCEFSVYGLLGG
jgi:GNAT superfamily N-acetyltransferase